ncbi:MAG: hypothetical protein ACI4D3_09155 [Lachnospiraceae bacterium]
MAFLIKCPNCQKDVSGTASRCPFCNADLTQLNDSGKQNTIYFSPDSGPAIHYPDFPEKAQTAPSKKMQIPDAEKTQHLSESGSDAEAGEHRPSVSESPSTRKRRKARPAGRKLLGYRAGNPFYMFVSVFYHMTACVGILYALSLSPQYMTDGVLIFHICRVVLAAIMLFLPVLLLSENKVRRKFPLLRSRKPAALAAGFLLLYLPLGALFLASWYFCM